MNMRKYVFLGILVLCVIVAGSFLWLKKTHTADIGNIDASNSNSFAPFGSGSTSTTQSTTPSGGSGSGSTTTSKSPLTPEIIAKVKNMSTMYGEGNYEIVSAENYDLSFREQDSSFNLTITAPPVGWARKLGEDKLIEILGIPKEEICKLDVMVGAPFDVDPNGPYGYGLSFCPGSVVLPALNPNAQ